MTRRHRATVCDRPRSRGDPSRGVSVVPSLFVIRGNDQGTRFELEESLFRIGRDAANSIQVHDTEVSRQHAELRRSDQDFAISDLNSSNGTFVNGRRVQRHALASGDQIQVGRTLILYTGPADESEEDLTKTISITSVEPAEEKSHIIHSVKQEESSQIFGGDEQFSQNPWLARARSNLQVMYRTALAVSHTLDIDQLLQRIMELIFEWVEADRGCVMLVDPQTKALQPKVRRTRDGVRTDEKISISKTILDYVIERNEGVLTSDARQDDRWNPTGSIVKMGIREAICVPLRGRYDVVGAIYIDTHSSPQEMIRQGGTTKFTEDHLKLMIAIAHQAALAVEDTRYYSAMVQAERLAAVGQTVATLSHHIKNILQGIRGGSYLIEMGLTDHDETVIHKGWNIVEKNQKKISDLVMDMLTFSKEREPELTTANVNDVVAEVVELMQVHCDELEIDLRWLPGDDMPDMIFDPEGLHRAVLNVVTNAVEAIGAAEQPGRIDVQSKCLAEKSLVRIVVIDDGPGIPADQIEQLFSPFAASKKSRGTGLGLPVSQKILNEHGGRITVASAPGRGSRFTLELPVTLPKPTSQTSAHDTKQ